MKTGTARYKAACHVRQRRRSMALRQRVHELEAQNRDLCTYAAALGTRLEQEQERAQRWESLYRDACRSAATLSRVLRDGLRMELFGEEGEG